jgi:hypothetical protein
MTPKSRKKRVVEIYFVLYLSALILLIPDKNEQKDSVTPAIMSLLASSFTIQPEHQVMMCRLKRSGDSIEVISCDSINNLFVSGAVEDIQYSIEIEDNTYKQLLSLATNGNSSTVGSSSFSLTDADISNKIGRVRFNWTPQFSAQANRLYNVKVKATAKPILPQSIPTKQREYLTELIGDGARITATTKFSVAMILMNTQNSNQSFALDKNSLDNMDSASRTRILELERELTATRNALSVASSSSASVPTGDFILQPRYDVIKTLSYQEWENRFTVYGADPRKELSGVPKLSGGQGYVTIEGNEIVVKGIAPQSSMTSYSLYAKRSADGKEFTSQFNVYGQSVPIPSIPPVMYPGIKYEFKPNLPQMTGTPITASLRDGSNSIRVSSLQGENFTFTPSVNDTNTTLYFERTINSKKIGQSFQIAVASFPPPEILDITTGSNGMVRIRTRSYGIQNDNNARCKIELLSGGSSPSKIQELYGDYSFDKQSNVHLQVFQLQSPSINLTVRAITGTKKVSAPREILSR